MVDERVNLDVASLREDVSEEPGRQLERTSALRRRIRLADNNRELASNNNKELVTNSQWRVEPPVVERLRGGQRCDNSNEPQWMERNQFARYALLFGMLPKDSEEGVQAANCS
ncbi:hypothetical protein Pcac1_g25974 [Phytophthora cactorum]|uniref:Uncharacterized protein n=1 Tax=Phytophthora cactorum TaxID=29920 RepID=A0A8T1D2U0_9STRA|nr:hypothetical protein Pcac1_g25974 [Phytophthora cactorum]KAG2822882.1 hypothetical protein PC111_g10446 [Phytophthora cactorum]KAG2916533.1 hypothetical protein PC115_g11040 [Phytophthora cactorum]KAG2936005.1 hypothetical protein PC117_g12254 [Phytophthora cactorum]KAG3013929.1 hypothetical protein PC119_g12328 [Phytophthora cactorum]